MASYRHPVLVIGVRFNVCAAVELSQQKDIERKQCRNKIDAHSANQRWTLEIPMNEKRWRPKILPPEELETFQCVESA